MLSFFQPFHTVGSGGGGGGERGYPSEVVVGIGCVTALMMSSFLCSLLLMVAPVQVDAPLMEENKPE